MYAGRYSEVVFRKLTYIKALFDHKQKISEYDVSLSVSYMEIYRDEVYDLLVDRDTVSHVFAVRSEKELILHANPLPVGPQVTSQGE
jgi:hypothetical protein